MPFAADTTIGTLMARSAGAHPGVRCARRAPSAAAVGGRRRSRRPARRGPTGRPAAQGDRGTWTGRRPCPSPAPSSCPTWTSTSAGTRRCCRARRSSPGRARGRRADPLAPDPRPSRRERRRHRREASGRPRRRRGRRRVRSPACSPRRSGRSSRPGPTAPTLFTRPEHVVPDLAGRRRRPIGGEVLDDLNFDVRLRAGVHQRGTAPGSVVDQATGRRRRSCGRAQTLTVTVSRGP